MRHTELCRSTMGSAVALILFVGGAAVAQTTRDRENPGVGDDPRLSKGQIAPVLEGLGDHHHPITTDSETAQLFFDQGLRLTFAFNHAEALRAYKEAARLDPDCAMCYWGWGLVLGPNINMPMPDDNVEEAYETIRKALELEDRVTEQERAYVEALARRYAGSVEADRAALDQDYADAMKAVTLRYPEDTDAATLYAAALMNLSAWDYWLKDGQPRPNTPAILATLERVIELDPRHPGALHYYIHAVEAVYPERAETSADTLLDLMPGAGHMVHMPSHIYVRLGRYADAYESNRRAVIADEGYITQCRAQGIYPLGYYPHNIHFMGWAANRQGRQEEAMEAARKVASKVPADVSGDDLALMQSFLAWPYYTMVRFGLGDEILAEPAPREDTTFLVGIWHYARGMAYLWKDKPARAEAELGSLRQIVDGMEAPELVIGFTSDQKLLTIAVEVLTGELAAKRGDTQTALAHLDRAVRLEDSLAYTEPPDWYYPIRQTLGAVLLEAGYADEAETVYAEDLRKNPHNGRSLYGLMLSLEAQGKDEYATEVKARFDATWADADVVLMSSRF